MARNQTIFILSGLALLAYLMRSNTTQANYTGPGSIPDNRANTPNNNLFTQNETSAEPGIFAQIEEKINTMVNGTRGERNNNPGNIEISNSIWQGQTGADGVYLIFSSPEYGIRAMGIDLVHKYQRGLNTVAKIIRVYSPASGAGNNEMITNNYIQSVSDELGVTLDTDVELLDRENLEAMVNAMIRHENGRNIFADSGVTSAGLDLIT